MLPRLLLLVYAVITLSLANAFIDNGILGDPYVNCGANSIDVRFDTRNTFRGIVFVEDHLGDPECRSAPVDGSSNDQIRNASLSLGFKDCGIERRSSNDPKGIFITTTLVVAFNAEYLTKIDRVYVVQCYYMEMENMLEKQINVDMPPPPLQTQQVPMPVCRYEVLDGTPEGPPVFYATIGQMVYHKWTCEAQTENQFCMKVHSCTVDDGNGDKVELLNSEGCAHDKYLLQNLDYVSDLMVGKEAHVYKYADKQSMFFDCQITLTIKEPDQQYCDVPNCPDPPRRRRANQKSLIDDASISSSSSSLSLNPKIAKESSSFPVEGITELQAEYIIDPQQAQHSSWINDNFAFTEENVCMSKTGIGSIAFINIFFMSISGILFWIAFCTFKAS